MSQTEQVVPTVSIFEVPIRAQTLSQAIKTLHQWAHEPNRRYVCLCTVYTLMMSNEVPLIKDALCGADMVVADGMPLVWLQQKSGQVDAQRVYGPEVLNGLCAVGQASGLRHYFLGSKPSVLEALSARLQEQFPTLNIVGTLAPPQIAIGEQLPTHMIEIINAAAPDVIWVGLGSPKQDVWMAQQRAVLNAPLLIGIGAAFDFVSNTKPQAPLWMQRNGLEWLYRLLQEPRRLWRRYFIYNSKFLWQLFIQKGNHNHNN